MKKRLQSCLRGVDVRPKWRLRNRGKKFARQSLVPQRGQSRFGEGNPGFWTLSDFMLVDQQ
jgi:hypothetical protein